MVRGVCKCFDFSEEFSGEFPYVVHTTKYKVDHNLQDEEDVLYCFSGGVSRNRFCHQRTTPPYLKLGTCLLTLWPCCVFSCIWAYIPLIIILKDTGSLACKTFTIKSLYRYRYRLYDIIFLNLRLLKIHAFSKNPK